MLDWVLAAGAGIVVTALSILSAHISATKSWHHVAAYILGPLAVVLILVQAYRNHSLQTENFHAQEEHRKAQIALQSDVAALRNQVKELARGVVRASGSAVTAFPRTAPPSSVETQRQAGKPEMKPESKSERPTLYVEGSKSLTPVARTTVTTRPAVGTRVYPHATQVILETDLPVQNPEFNIGCVCEIYDARVFIAGEPTIWDLKTSLSVNRSELTVSFSSPAFSPGSPVIVTLFSKSPFLAVSAYRTPKGRAEAAAALNEHFSERRKTISDPVEGRPK
jgi:hypothetical protein